MVLIAQFPLVWYATWLHSEKMVWPFRPHPWDQGCVCGLRICYYVAACVIDFNLRCSMTIFWKCLILASSFKIKRSFCAYTISRFVEYLIYDLEYSIPEFSSCNKIFDFSQCTNGSLMYIGEVSHSWRWIWVVCWKRQDPYKLL